MDTEELHRLARDRRQWTRELHGPNDFYGHAGLLKRYASLPPRQPLHATVEHGLTALPTVWYFDVSAPFPTFLCAGEQRAEAYRRVRPDRTAIPIGPMIHYAADGPPAPRVRGRLLVFPAHSTHDLRSGFDVAAFARTIAGYRDRFEDVTVCLYWKDVLQGAEAVYRAEGFDCVTAGHMFDPDFLPRLRRIIEASGTVMTNRFGSYLPYAVALGRPVWLRPQRVTLLGDQKIVERESVEPEVDEAAWSEIAHVFGDEVDELTPSHYECLEPVTGFQHLRSPDALRDIFAEAAERYRAATTPLQRARHQVVARVLRPLGQLVPRPILRRIR